MSNVNEWKILLNVIKIKHYIVGLSTWMVSEIGVQEEWQFEVALLQRQNRS